MEAEKSYTWIHFAQLMIYYYITLNQSWNRVGFGSGSGSKLISSNFVRNFFKFNDLILFLKDYIYIRNIIWNFNEMT